MFTIQLLKQTNIQNRTTSVPCIEPTKFLLKKQTPLSLGPRNGKNSTRMPSIALIRMGMACSSESWWKLSCFCFPFGLTIFVFLFLRYRSRMVSFCGVLLLFRHYWVSFLGDDYFAVWVRLETAMQLFEAFVWKGSLRPPVGSFHVFTLHRTGY